MFFGIMKLGVAGPVGFVTNPYVWFWILSSVGGLAVIFAYAWLIVHVLKIPASHDFANLQQVLGGSILIVTAGVYGVAKIVAKILPVTFSDEDLASVAVMMMIFGTGFLAFLVVGLSAAEDEKKAASS